MAGAIPAIGIDLGTAYSCVGYWKNDRVEIIPNDQGNRITPSYVAFTHKERLVGDAAVNQVALNPANTIFDAKRLIGRRYSDESVQSDIKLWPFKVIPGTDDKPMISVIFKGQKKEFAPEQISSMVLMKLKQISEAYIGSKVKEAVVTVPSYFNQSQRKATMDAGEIAGINVLQIISEPVAAAIAYAFENSDGLTERRNVLVFDLGGGTLDVSILEIENSTFQVKATAGEGHLGGEDFDCRLVKHFVKEFKKKHQKDLSENPKSVRRLRTACEKAKRLISFASEARIEIDALFEGIDYIEVLTESKFVELNMDLFNKCIETVEKCLKDGMINKNAVDDVVLVGGSSRIPKVQQLLRDFFSGKELSRSIQQDEAVAYGAAVQAAFLSGYGNEKVRNLVFKEVTPLSLGVETGGKSMFVLIPRNTIIPITVKVAGFETVDDDQTMVSFNLLEGERARSTDNQFLGKLELTGLKEALKGEVKVEVCFDLQANGILNASAKDIITGKEASITVTTGNLPSEEIEKMIEEAKRYWEYDQKYTRKNEADQAFRDYLFQLKDDMKKKKQRLMKDEDVINMAVERFSQLRDEARKKKQKIMKDEAEIMAAIERLDTLAEDDEYEAMKEELTHFCFILLVQLWEHVVQLRENMKKKQKTEKVEDVIKAALKLLDARKGLREVEEYEKMEEKLKILFK